MGFLGDYHLCKCLSSGHHLPHPRDVQPCYLGSESWKSEEGNGRRKVLRATRKGREEFEEHFRGDFAQAFCHAWCVPCLLAERGRTLMI